MAKYFKINHMVSELGVPAATLRYYEKIGLIKPIRDVNDYRLYRQSDLEKLRLINNAKTLGMSLKEIRRLMAIIDRPGQRATTVISFLQEKLEETDTKIKEMREMKKRLSELLGICSGNMLIDECPIIKKLKG